MQITRSPAHALPTITMTYQLLITNDQVLVQITRSPAHVPLLVREGGVPAVLAAILAHLRSVEVLRAALLTTYYSVPSTYST